MDFSQLQRELLSRDASATILRKADTDKRWTATVTSKQGNRATGYGETIEGALADALQAFDAQR